MLNDQLITLRLSETGRCVHVPVRQINAFDDGMPQQNATGLIVTTSPIPPRVLCNGGFVAIDNYEDAVKQYRRATYFGGWRGLRADISQETE